MKILKHRDECEPPLWTTLTKKDHIRGVVKFLPDSLAFPHYWFNVTRELLLVSGFPAKLGNLEKIVKFLEIYNLRKLNQRETERPNRPIMTKEIESVIKNLPAKKSPTRRFHGEFYQTFTEELIPIISKVFQKVKEKIPFSNSFCKANITSIPK